MSRFASIALCLAIAAAVAAGCGSKKPDADTAADQAGDAGADAAPDDGLEAEADTGPTEYPEPPERSASGRDTHGFEVWARKAFVLPLSEDGKCWDRCSAEAKKELAGSMVDLATVAKPGDDFVMASKAVGGTMGASGEVAALPDLYLHIDCGFGQTYTTGKTSSEDRLAARWKGAMEKMELDGEDVCSISVWDADAEGDDELLGATEAKIVKAAWASSGKVQLFGADEDFGQVYMVELELVQLDGTAPAPAASEPAPAAPAPTASTPAPTTSTPAPTTSTPAPSTSAPTAGRYRIEVVKANLTAKKDDGKEWDSSKTGSLLGKIGMKDAAPPDPFVEVYVNRLTESPVFSTSAAKDKHYYEWREAGEVTLEPGDRLIFDVFDKDLADHDLAGECKSDPIEKIPQGSEVYLKSCGQVKFLAFKVTKL